MVIAISIILFLSTIVDLGLHSPSTNLQGIIITTPLPSEISNSNKTARSAGEVINFWSEEDLSFQDIIDSIEIVGADDNDSGGRCEIGVYDASIKKFHVLNNSIFAGDAVKEENLDFIIPSGNGFHIICDKDFKTVGLNSADIQPGRKLVTAYDVNNAANGWFFLPFNNNEEFVKIINSCESRIETVYVQNSDDYGFELIDLRHPALAQGYYMAWIKITGSVGTCTDAPEDSGFKILSISLDKTELIIDEDDDLGITVNVSEDFIDNTNYEYRIYSSDISDITTENAFDLEKAVYSKGYFSSDDNSYSWDISDFEEGDYTLFVKANNNNDSSVKSVNFTYSAAPATEIILDHFYISPSTYTLGVFTGGIKFDASANLNGAKFTMRIFTEDQLAYIDDSDDSTAFLINNNDLYFYNKVFEDANKNDFIDSWGNSYLESKLTDKGYPDGGDFTAYLRIEYDGFETIYTKKEFTINHTGKATNPVTDAEITVVNSEKIIINNLELLSSYQEDSVEYRARIFTSADYANNYSNNKKLAFDEEVDCIKDFDGDVDVSDGFDVFNWDSKDDDLSDADVGTDDDLTVLIQFLPDENDMEEMFIEKVFNDE